ncbi:MAG: methionyl-tRNA formyltransferase [Actinomycetes bacterium]
MAKIIYLGSPEAAVAPLKALLDAGHEVALVISQPDRRRGRGGDLSPTPVKAFALSQGLSVSEDLGLISSSDAELAVVVAYGRIIPSERLAQMPFLNIHFSLLPRWRGAAPVERAILEGDDVSGVSIMALEESLDTGAVYARAELALGEKTAEEILSDLSNLGASLLIELLAKGLEGLPEPVAQVGEASYAKKISAGDLRISASMTAEEMLRRVRLGRASLGVLGRRVGIITAHCADSEPGDEPGSLAGFVLCTSSGRLVLDVVQPEGKRPLAAQDWFRGARLPTVAPLD